MQSILQILSHHQLLPQATLSSYFYVLYDQRLEQKLNYKLERSYDLQFPYSVTTQTFKQVQEKLQNLNLQINISQSKQGKKMPIYSDLDQLNSEQKTTLQHKQNQVLLVDIWATWCGPCQKPMQHNQQMLSRNEQKWKDKVRIVAVSVDEEKDTILQRVNSKGWNKIQHLTLLGWKNQHPLISDFQVQGIPFVFLVDKSGEIDYAGHPMSINLEQRINQLLEEEISTEKKQQEEPKVQLQKIVAETKKWDSFANQVFKQVLQNKFGKLELFSFKGYGKSTLSKGKYEAQPLQLIVSVYQDDKQSVQEFKDHLKNVDESLYKIQENIVKYEVPPSIQNAQCVECKTKLQYPFYWCKWDPTPNTFRCRNCVERKPTQQGKHYSYLQNSVLLTGPFKKIAIKSFGKNIQPSDITEVKAPFNFCCNGCGLVPQKIGQARYICLGCRSEPNYRGDYVDVCEKCFAKLMDRDEQVKQNLKHDGHSENHPLLRVLYNVSGYYNF